MSLFAAPLVVVSLLAAGQVSAQPSGQVVIDRCLVSLIDEVNVPAQETGVLTLVPVKRGSQVATGDELALIDDSIPQKQKEIATLKWQQAQEQATNQVDIKYAAKAAEVAKAEYDKMRATNEGLKGTIADITVEKARLQWERAILQAEQADMNFKVAGMAAGEAQAETEAAQMIIDKCRTKSPIDGVVVQLYHQEGEWVRPGDPLMRVVGLKRLKVEGSLNADQLTPGEVRGKPVTVVASLPSGPVTFEGFIDFASPEIDATGQFDFSAEVENRAEGGFWQLLPGEVASVTVHIDRPAVNQREFAGVPR